MFKTIRVKLNERVVIFKDGLPQRAFGPGRHRLWGRRFTEQRFFTDELVMQCLPEVRTVLPNDWFREVTLSRSERGILYRDGVPAVFLRPGVHRFWTVDPSVKLDVLDVTVPLPPLTRELEALIPNREFIDVTVAEHEAGLRFEQGRFVSQLGPGRYRFWSTPEAKAEIRTVDMRRQSLTLGAQELMTRDKVSLRLTLTVDFAVVDPLRVAKKTATPGDVVYLAVQLAARDFVSSVTLDELLEGREALTRHLESAVTPEAKGIGLVVERVGVKDVVLPGEMKTLLNRVIEAEKEAAANVILRREETAATRSLANTAKVMADHPVLLRLKELEAMKEIAEHIGEVRVVVGADGLGALLPSELLGKTSRTAS